MKMKLCLVFFILVSASSFGQWSNRYEIDTVQLFTGDNLIYEFNLFGPTQGLFFDSCTYQKLPRIQLKIVNNSEDTVIQHYRSKDAHLMWFRMGGSCNNCDTLAPYEHIILQSGWAAWGNRPIGPFTTTIEIITLTKEIANR